jgi:hypothetical protein
MIAKLLTRMGASFAVLALASGAATAKVTIAIGGAACLCYLPTVLAEQLGEYKKAGVEIELINFKGGSQALTAVIGGSADVVSGYYDHCVNLAAKNQNLQAFVVYDRYPGLVLGVSPRHTTEINSVRDIAGKKVGVSAPGSSTDFFLKYLLAKSGVAPDSVAVIGIGLDATAVVAMEQGTVDAAVMLDPTPTLLEAKFSGLKILSDTPHPGRHPVGLRRRISGRCALHAQRLDRQAREGDAGAHRRDPRHPEVDSFPYGGRDHGENAGRSGRARQGALSRSLEEYTTDVFEQRSHGSEGRRGGAQRLQPVLPRGGEGEDRFGEDLYEQVRRAGCAEAGIAIAAASPACGEAIAPAPAALLFLSPFAASAIG